MRGSGGCSGLGCAGGLVSVTPSQWLHSVLSGQTDLSDAPASIQSWARFPIFQGACDIIRMDTQDERRAELQKIPSKIRPHVEAEIKRLWPMRRDL